MASATLNLRVSPRRILSNREAAEYCGMPAKKFAIGCPVAPIEFPGGDRLFDIQDLDRWLDSLKGPPQDDDDALLARLGR